MVFANIFKKLLIGGAFSAEEGRIKLFGRMYWMLYPARAFALNLQNIGQKNGASYLYKLGYEAGYDAGKEMIDSMQIKPRGGWITQNAILELLEFIGFGKPQFVFKKTEEDGQHHIIMHLTNNPVVEHASRLFGSKSLICNWFMGVYAAHGELELGVKNPKLKENKCICKGAPYCEWETKWYK